MNWKEWSEQHYQWRDMPYYNGKLRFGTGGMRGHMGLGEGALNTLTVYQFASAFFKYIEASGKSMDTRVIISHDARRHADEFASTIAGRLDELGITVCLLDGIHATPELTFGVKLLHCDYGIMVTASHNPKDDNGIKVYDARGVQLLPEETSIIDDYMANETLVNPELMLTFEPNQALSTLVEDEYISMIKTLVKPEEAFSDISIVYTALEGAGARSFIRASKALGINNIHYTVKQLLPNGEFTYTPQLNPENEDAYAASILNGKHWKADILLATDPDADRLGMMVKNKEGHYQRLTGNELGALFISYLVEAGYLYKGDVIGTTIVSSDFGPAVARHYGLDVIKTLTGFKYLGDLMDRDLTIKFAYEESCGYNFFASTGDKDGVMAAVMAIKMAHFFKGKGLSLFEKLVELQGILGVYRDALVVIERTFDDYRSLAKSILDSLNEQGLLPLSVERLDQFKNGVQSLSGEGFLYHLAKGFIAIRPSGTEAKLKCYVSINSSTLQSVNDEMTLIKGIIQKVAS